MKTFITIILLCISFNSFAVSLPDVSSWTTAQLEAYDHEKQFKPDCNDTATCRAERLRLRLESHAVRGELLQRTYDSAEIKSCGSVGCINRNINTIHCETYKVGDLIRTECY